MYARAISRTRSPQRATRSPWNGGSSSLRLCRWRGGGVTISELGPMTGSSSSAALPPTKRSLSVRMAWLVSASVPQMKPVLYGSSRRVNTGPLRSRARTTSPIGSVAKRTVCSQRFERAAGGNFAASQRGSSILAIYIRKTP